MQHHASRRVHRGLQTAYRYRVERQHATQSFTHRGIATRTAQLRRSQTARLHHIARRPQRPAKRQIPSVRNRDSPQRRLRPNRSLQRHVAARGEHCQPPPGDRIPAPIAPITAAITAAAITDSIPRPVFSWRRGSAVDRLMEPHESLRAGGHVQRHIARQNHATFNVDALGERRHFGGGVNGGAKADLRNARRREQVAVLAQHDHAVGP